MHQRDVLVIARCQDALWRYRDAGRGQYIHMEH